MDCSEAKSHLSAFASGLTNDLDKAEIEAHIAECEECSLEVELLRGHSSGKTPPPPDWTLEKIFGEGQGGAGGADAESASPGSEATAEAIASANPFAMDDLEGRSAAESPAAPPPAPAQPTEPQGAASRPSMILPPPAPDPTPASASKSEPSPGKAKGSTSKAKRESWDFEPADASREAAPPEESLAFAEEALTRQKVGRTSPKSAAMRAAGWSVGGLAGLGLLAASIWIAMAMHQAPTREVTTRAARTRTSALVPAPPDRDSAGPVASVTPTTANASPTPAPESASTSMSAPESVEPPIQARSLAAAPPPAVTSPPRSTPSKVPAQAIAPSAAPNASNQARKAATPQHPAAPSGSAATPQTTAQTDAPTPAPRATAKEPPPKPANRDDDDMWPTDDPVRPAKGSNETTGQAVAPKAAAPIATPPAPNRAVVVPPVTDEPVTAPPVSSGNPAIERLHLATEKATAEQDLETLRQLRTAWRNFLRTAVGRDRSRTKREYADCLWTIQALTSRDSDQRAALNAYRDYLLNAPAGGADPRSAERLRELEDALRER